MKQSDGISTKAVPTFDGADFDTERSQQDEEERKTSLLNDFQHIGHGYLDVDQYNNATDTDYKDDETESKKMNLKRRYLNLFQKMILLHIHGMMMDQ